MSKQKLLPTVLVAAALASGSALASEPVPVPTDDVRFTVQTATCGDLYELLQDAAAGEGKDPVIMEKAQNVLLYFVIWAHGYLSGRDGIDEEKRPLSSEGIELTVKQIGDRAILSDCFDYGTAESWGDKGMASRHHKTGYNVLYSDLHAVWYGDNKRDILYWKWVNPANANILNDLTISGPESQEVWHLFDAANGVDI